jgi:hypothetical protein
MSDYVVTSGMFNIQAMFLMEARQAKESGLNLIKSTFFVLKNYNVYKV